MANDLNHAVLIGRLVSDPQLRYAKSGTAVASFTLANNKSYSTGGEKKDQVSYFDCVAWSKLGEIMAEYCQKGKMIAVEGRLSQRRWDDQDGNKKSKIEIVVENFQFLSGGKSEDSSEKSNSSKPDNTEPPDPRHYEENPFSDPDIPF